MSYIILSFKNHVIYASLFIGVFITRNIHIFLCVIKIQKFYKTRYKNKKYFFKYFSTKNKFTKLCVRFFYNTYFCVCLFDMLLFITRCYFTLLLYTYFYHS